MFIERIEVLLSEKGVQKKTFLAELGLSKNSFVNWRDRGTIPSGATLQKIADYFGVSVDYLLGKAGSMESTADVETAIQRTKLLLKEKGLKQKYLFEQIGKSPVLFNDWKNGKSKPTDEVLKNIADVLDTTPEYLLGKTDRKSKPHISEEYRKLIEEREAHTALVMGFGGDRQIIEVPEGAEEVILATIAAWRKKQAEENKKK